MTVYKIQASWNYRSGEVEYSFGRREQMTDKRHAQRVAHAIERGASPDVDRTVCAHLGDATGPLCTARQAEQFAMAWLAEHAGMVEGDSIILHLFAQATPETIDQLTAAATA